MEVTNAGFKPAAEDRSSATAKDPWRSLILYAHVLTPSVLRRRKQQLNFLGLRRPAFLAIFFIVKKLSCQLSDITRTMKMKKDLNVVTGGWWRWTRYEIRDGCIRPAPGSRLESYDPRDIWLRTRPPAKSSNQRRSGEPPYQSLLRLLGELEYRRPGDAQLDFTPAQVDRLLAPLTDESEAKLLKWCAQYGLLGILLHRTVHITLAPRTRLYQVQHTKIGAGWSTTEIPITRHQPIVIPFAIVQPLRGAGPVSERLGITWARFFPNVPPVQCESFSYPTPLTEEFWKSYAEPVEDFLLGMRALLDLHQTIRVFQSESLKAQRLLELKDALTPRHLVAEGLLAGVSLALQWNTDRRIQQKWVTSSLLASLATTMLEDLTYGRALECPGCGHPFVSGAYQAKFCSVRCRWAEQKRASRAGRKSRVGVGPRERGFTRAR